MTRPPRWFRSPAASTKAASAIRSGDPFAMKGMSLTDTGAHSINHTHVFLDDGHRSSEHRTWAVIVLCSVMLLGETVGGLVFGSIALVADGHHKSTHAG